jgi:prevent-host-death family protein
MTIHVNIGEAKTRLSELVAAVERGEEVVLQRAGDPKARIVAIADADAAKRDANAKERVANLGFAAAKYRGVDLTVQPYFDEEYEEERYRRKFGEPVT